MKDGAAPRKKGVRANPRPEASTRGGTEKKKKKQLQEAGENGKRSPRRRKLCEERNE
jgi:hypothetical protein